MRTLISAIALTFTVAACGGGDDTSSESPAPSASTPAAEAPASGTTTAPAASPAAATETSELEKGKRIFAQCKACHQVSAEGRNMTGPNLYGVVGSAAGSVEGFNYSPAMANSGVIWTEEAISAYLENPRGFMPGNRMAFNGLRKEADRNAVIAYMKAESAK